MGNVFISYRRDDAAGYARAIYDQLTERFDTAQVFMDVDAIEPGLPFDEVIRNAVGQCEVLLVLIGSRWMEVQPDGRRRLDDERDFVRLEIAAALARNIRVIPVLLDGVQMPAEDLLPEPMRGLVWRNALEVSNTRFTSDVNRLADVLARVLGEAERSASATTEAATKSAASGADTVVSTSGAVANGSATAAVGDARDVGGKGGKGLRVMLVAGAVVVAGAIA
uniref:toll/interleukin-1 receptor domain-containing protein n=1 Tax=Thauera sp. TaxID=1905334 RepID=UPI00257B3134